MKRFLLFLLLLFTLSSVKSQTYDSLQVSLLTVAPHSEAVWTYFGHTALRLYDPTREIDMVYNWGTFDMGKPNFHFRFMLGKTDYFLSAYSFRQFFMQYARHGVAMTEQVLNIPASEKEALLNSLQINLLPQNVEYRYNFVFDNCTTRPRDIIEQFCGGTLIYPKQVQPITFRQLFHQYTQKYPWTEFGIDCVIGSGADSLITYRSELFLPEKLMDALNHSIVKLPNGDEQAIVLSSKLILQSTDEQAVRLRFWEYSFVIGSFLFILYLILGIWSQKAVIPRLTRNPLKDSANYKGIAGQARNDKAIRGIARLTFSDMITRLLFALLFFVAGAAGCIVAMLNFFSLHPCVQLNWNIIWLHPLHFIACVGFFLRKSYRWIRWYHAVNFVILSSFLLGWHWIPQELNKASIPFILCLWIVSGLQLIIKEKKK